MANPRTQCVPVDQTSWSRRNTGGRCGPPGAGPAALFYRNSWAGNAALQPPVTLGRECGRRGLGSLLLSGSVAGEDRPPGQGDGGQGRHWTRRPDVKEAGCGQCRRPRQGQTLDGKCSEGHRPLQVNSIIGQRLGACPVQPYPPAHPPVHPPVTHPPTDPPSRPPVLPSVYAGHVFLRASHAWSTE